MKNRNKCIIFLLLSILFLVPYSLSQANFRVTLDKTYVEVPTLGSQIVKITIYNDQDFEDLFSLSLFPSSIYGISGTFQVPTIKIGAHSSESIYILFTAAINSEEIPINFKITITSSKTGYSKQLTLTVKARRTVPVYISDVRVNKYLVDPGEIISVFVDLTNVENKLSGKYFVDLNITKDGQTIYTDRKEVEAIEPQSTRTIEFSYQFNQYAPNGTYEIYVTLRNEENEKVYEKGPIVVKVNGIVKLPSSYTEKEVHYGVLTSEVVIKVKNEGNIPSGPFLVTETLPSIARSFFIAETPITSENVTDGVVTYIWRIENLNPGETVVIKYKIFVFHFWLILVCVGLLFIYIFHVTFSLSIKKSTLYKGPIQREKTIKVVINVKNKTNKTLRNVKVIDFVPALLKVLNKFDTLVPKVKKMKDGYELEWRIYSLKPKEERVLTYYVKPIVDIVGEIKLPEVRIEYKEKNKKKVIKSKKATIKSTEEKEE